MQKKRLVADRMDIDANGFARIDVCLSNEGVMPYYEYDEEGNETVTKALMPKEELEKLTKKKQNVPVTIEHPEDGVDTNNSRELVVGFVDSNLYMKGDELWGQLVLTDKEAIEAVQSGKSDVSMGYSESRGRGGKLDGEAYDYSKKNLVLNHLALVDAGRAEKAALSFDSKNQTYSVNQLVNFTKNTNMNLKTIITDSGEIELTDSSVPTLQDMMAKMDAMSKEFEAYKSKMMSEKDSQNGEVAAYQIKADAQDAEIAALKQELETLKANTVDASAIDAEITARLEAWDSIGGINNKSVAFDSALTVAQIQRAKVKSIVGDSVDLDAQSDEFVKGMFLALNNQKAVDAKQVEAPVAAKVVTNIVDSQAPKAQAPANTRKASDNSVGFSLFNN
ncbi:MAG: hypothetical protein RLZZ69_2780 [Cyanobacteriota bacterium]|jgi:hypothetical protein